MMKFIWHSRKTVDVQSAVWHESCTIPGVKFSIRRVSLRGRLELMRAMRDLLAKNEFLRAGDSLDQTEAAISDLLAKKLYVEWGLCETAGLTIDGKPANVAALIESGPEALCNEVVDSIRPSLELSEAERKNF